MNRKQYIITILLLGALATVSPFSIDMYLPGFPAIANDLKTTVAGIQYSLTAYLIGIAVGQLLYGPLLDRFGRRAPLYAGLAVYILASVGCSFSYSLESLVVMRFLQAVGGCAGMVASQTLVRDLFPTNKTAQAFSSITLVIAVSPMIAPTLGGYLTVAFGWPSIFLMLALLTLIIGLCVHLFLPGGKTADPGISLHPTEVLKNFVQVIKQPQFITYALAGGIAMSAPFAYIAASSDVFMNIYHFSEKEYGWIFAIVASGLIGTAQLNHLLLQRFQNEQLVRYALRFQLVIGIALTVGIVLNRYNDIELVILVFLFFTGQGITGPNSTALALAPFTRHTGSAASLLGSFRMTIAGLVSAVVSIWYDGTALPMVATMLFCIAIPLAILTFSKVVVRYKARGQKQEDESVLM
jgi:DHA1 family bicyclomycin/chloramphenicol resistance-like MFS transporter